MSIAIYNVTGDVTSPNVRFYFLGRRKWVSVWSSSKRRHHTRLHRSSTSSYVGHLEIRLHFYSTTTSCTHCSLLGLVLSPYECTRWSIRTLGCPYVRAVRSRLTYEYPISTALPILLYVCRDCAIWTVSIRKLLLFSDVCFDRLEISGWDSCFFFRFDLNDDVDVCRMIRSEIVSLYNGCWLLKKKRLRAIALCTVKVLICRFSYFYIWITKRLAAKTVMTVS